MHPDCENLPHASFRFLHETDLIILSLMHYTYYSFYSCCWCSCVRARFLHLCSWFVVCVCVHHAGLTDLGRKGPSRPVGLYHSSAGARMKNLYPTFSGVGTVPPRGHFASPWPHCWQSYPNRRPQWRRDQTRVRQVPPTPHPTANTHRHCPNRPHWLD